ncbi:MAG: hypothetical protein U1F18_14300 [Steroidobacteraceae bacterium]
MSGATGPSSKSSPLAAFVERFALVGAWLVVIAGFGVLLPGSFLTWQNFAVMFASQAPAALLALALIVPLTCGDYDLSGGATVTLAAVILGVLNVNHQEPIGFALAVALGAGVLVGVVNAFFIVYVRIPSLVVTLGTASLVTGFVQWFSDSSTISGLDGTFVDWIITKQLSASPTPSTSRCWSRCCCGTCSSTRRSAAACCSSARAARLRASTASASTTCEPAR